PTRPAACKPQPRSLAYLAYPSTSSHTLLFLFSSLRPPSDLPFSPTRRSPDLQVPEGPERLAAPRPLVESAAESLGAARLTLEDRDRKSTRLNSSHVSISYAVFCLKKKTNDHHNRQRSR